MNMMMPALAAAQVPQPAPQFWVVGGEYRTTAFNELCGPAEAVGPFRSYDDAFTVWKERSTATRPDALIRYTIVGRPNR